MLGAENVARIQDAPAPWQSCPQALSSHPSQLLCVHSPLTPGRAVSECVCWCVRVHTCVLAGTPRGTDPTWVGWAGVLQEQRESSYRRPARREPPLFLWTLPTRWCLVAPGRPCLLWPQFPSRPSRLVVDPHLLGPVWMLTGLSPLGEWRGRAWGSRASLQPGTRVRPERGFGRRVHREARARACGQCVLGQHRRLPVRRVPRPRTALRAPRPLRCLKRP